MCHEIFDLPSGPLINRVKYFRIRFRFSPDIRIFKNWGVKLTSSQGVKLRGVHHTAESWKNVFKKTPRCASYRGVSSLPSVCFDSKFYNSYFSVMPKDITMKIILKVTNCSRNLFYIRRFSIKHSWKTSQIRKQQNGHFRSSLTLKCNAHCEVRLRGVHLSPESSDPNFFKNSAVCFIPRSQAPRCASYLTLRCASASHCGVKLHTPESESKILLLSGCF